jgi:NodT family efflux transporter outer membrane factor (OMF) lipoprotein
MLIGPVGCMTPSREPTPPVDVPAAFSRSQGDPIPDAWWTTFEDAQLNALIDRAFRDSVDLKTAWYRLQEARAVSRQATSRLFPELLGFLDAEGNEGDGGTEERLELGLAAEYEVDLWGGVKASADAQRLLAEASRYDFQAGALTLSAEIARTWIALLGSGLQLALLEEQVKANAQVLHLLERRFAGGQTRSVDVLRQRQLVAATRQQQHEAAAARELLEHRLAVLIGQPPQNLPPYEVTDLPRMPPLPESGLPLELVRRRPDVRAAYARLQAADRETAAAVSERFPRVNLSASYSTVDDDVQALFDDWAWSLAGNLVAPLLDAGRRKAGVDRARAREQQRLYEYGGTVLGSFRDVEDALTLERQQRLQMQRLKEQLAAAEQANSQLQVEYLNGVGNFIDVLASQIDEQQLRRDLITSRSLLLEIRIGLYRALAGSLELAWETDL